MFSRAWVVLYYPSLRIWVLSLDCNIACLCIWHTFELSFPEQCWAQFLIRFRTIPLHQVDDEHLRCKRLKQWSRVSTFDIAVERISKARENKDTHLPSMTLETDSTIILSSPPIATGLCALSSRSQRLLLSPSPYFKYRTMVYVTSFHEWWSGCANDWQSQHRFPHGEGVPFHSVLPFFGRVLKAGCYHVIGALNESQTLRYILCSS